MESGKRALRFSFYGLWAVVMTALTITFVLGAVSLKVLRREAGRVHYWFIGSAFTGILFAMKATPLALAYGSLVLLVGVFSELEELGLGVLTSGFFTLVINFLCGAGVFALWVSRTGPKWSQFIQDGLELMLKPLVELNPKLQINYFDLMLQIPSLLLILWMCAIYFAVLLENRVRPIEQQGMKGQLAEFRLPDFVVWLFIGALLGAFGGLAKMPVEAVSVNVLNVCFMLFFFQGIAVVARFFETLRMGWFWQTVFMVLIVVHLFLPVSLLGLIDYWVDFRARMQKRGNEEINGGT
jgi:hypothetical protein